jgi:response regulator RpfG family c-di-GMP phosphodiesterase
MQKILAIDDKMDNLITLSALLKNLMPGCSVITTQSGLEGIEKAKKEQPDVILLDIKMPDMDGFETCCRLMSDERTKRIPVIMITAIKTDSESRIKGLEAGANTFLSKPIDEAELVSQVKVAFRIKKAEDALRKERDSLERLVEERTAALNESLVKLRKTLGGTVHAISMAVETRDPYTAGHQRRVADLARTIATEMGFSTDRTDFIRIAASIHDIGKIAVPAEILTKPTKLTDIEFNLIKIHSEAGYEILKDIEFSWPVADVVLQHHEWMNGSGYPNGLKKEELLPESRIITVADVVESMASYRPYRVALGINAALDEIAKNKGILYDPEVVDACLRLFNEKGYKLAN